MSLNALAERLAAEGHVCMLKHDGASLQIFQITTGGFCYFEIIPWRADPRVPVLYLTLYDEEGGVTRVASAAAAQQHLQGLTATKWLTQTEHPITALPVLFVHPCHTLDWLDATSGDWFLWLQHFGRSVGLEI